jgi:RNA-splicing ligase RtcB
MVNSIAFSGYPIAIMPDCHAGKGSVIGFTMPLTKYVVPEVVGVDIGCGMSSYSLFGIEIINFENLDNFIREEIPLGTNIHKVSFKFKNEKFKERIELLAKKVNCERALYSLGTLGGGNHFIEIGEVPIEGHKILTVHSGSRNLGERTCRYHQNKAKELTIQTKELKGYSVLEIGTKEATEYLQDMQTCQEYAQVNRFAIISKILEFFNREPLPFYNDCIHNYISSRDFIIRKGAINAREKEAVIIPLNMKDGIIFGIGKALKEWNFSAPHGAGRIKSRSQANKDLSLNKFKEEMREVYSTSINKHTLDEAPGAYKSSGMILETIKEVVDIKFIAKSVYNLKA